MDTRSAFAMWLTHRDKEAMVFDWDKAARIICERGAKTAGAGLRGDWDYTGGTIFLNGKPNLDSGAFLSSKWAVPELEIGGIKFDCYRMKSEVPDWNAHTEWPVSALAILDAALGSDHD